LFIGARIAWIALLCKVAPPAKLDEMGGQSRLTALGQGGGAPVSLIVAGETYGEYDLRLHSC